jgi:hypothetical protein
MKFFNIVSIAISISGGLWTFFFWLLWRSKDYYNKGLLISKNPKTLETVAEIDIWRSLIPLGLTVVLLTQENNLFLEILILLITMVRMLFWYIKYYKTKSRREEGYHLADRESVTISWLLLELFFFIPEIFLLIIIL